ncbi:MAG: hypothetical protein IKV96_01255 [Firmicutes bacterium]|nr:hypothetical protein [Bacillota bacterium]
MKTLCLYYTRTDTTRLAMERVAKVLGADLAEYTDGKDRSGAIGYLGACVASFKKSFPEVSVREDVQLSAYDRVIIGMPVWVEGPCVVGRAFINQFKDSLPAEVYYVVTHMGNAGYDAKIKAMDNILGREASGYVSIKTKNNAYLKDAEAFANGIKK